MSAQNERIKRTLGELDDGCRPDLKSRPDLLAMVVKLESDLDVFVEGFGIATPEPFGSEIPLAE